MDQRGFTYIELIVTVTILAILASVVIPLSEMSAKRSKEIELKTSLRIIRHAIDEYKAASDSGKIDKDMGSTGYPEELSKLTEGLTDKSNKDFDNTIRFLRRIPRDPMNNDSYLSNEDTWGLRSYDSDVEDPSEGDDVYDVYSKSSEVALDGTKYSDW